MKRLCGTLNFAFCLFLLTGCGSDSNSNSTPNKQSEDPVVVEDPVAVKATALITDQGDAFTDDNFIDCIINKIVAENTDGDSLEVNDLSELTILECDSLGIENVDGIELLTGLTRLKLNENKIMAIDLVNNIALTDLGIAGNQLEEIDVSTLTDLRYLNLSDNKLITLNLEENKLLTGLNVRWNQLTSSDSLFLSNKPDLRDLSLSDNAETLTIY
ncbi:hypothetical protein [Psychromonas sp.]|uniref:hypothetical protein n=1 Tax=Psychromonas sp. TaxID=1884585 RepID=UPI003565287F